MGGTTKNRFKMLAGALVFLVMLSAGCGDDATEPTPTPAPTLTAVAPADGSALGGTQLTLTGTNFVTGTTVTVGGVAATNVTIVGATSLTCITPAGTPGAADVAVTTGGGTATLASSFTYHPLPAITTVAPGTGSSFGGTTLTLTGTGFTANDAGTNVVTVGGADCTNVNAASDTQITCTSPAGTAGDVDVVVTNDNGAGTLEDGYNYFSTILVADGGGNPPPAAHNLYAVDAATGNVVTVGPIGFGVTCMDFHPTTGVLYGATAPGGAGGPRQLITIDPATGAGTLVANTDDAGAVNHLVYGCSFVGDILYGTDGPGLNLITVDVTTGLVTVVAPGRPLAPGGGFAADAADANVYFMSGNSTALQSVDVITGAFTPGPISKGQVGNFDRMPGATFHNGSLYAIESSPGMGDRQLAMVDVTTGALTPVGAITTGSLFNAIASATR